MEVIQQGEGELIGWHDPDENRNWVLKNKTRAPLDKRMSIKDAVTKFVKDGDAIAFGGFGHVRVSMVAVYEIVRQKKRNLALAGKTAVHEADILIGGECVSSVEVAYTFGHELRGLSHASRRAAQTGKVKVAAEISNAGLQWRLKAGAMGVPFLPTRILQGTDTFKYSSAKTVRDPYSGKLVCLVPAYYPDVGVVHVTRCDKYGNAQVDGTIIEDLELSQASRRLIVSTEEIISEDRIRQEPWKTVIPFYLVDAVVEQPYGCHPGNMPYMYHFDEDHMAEWLKLSKTDEGVKQYMDKYVFGVDDFSKYLDLIGGSKKLEYLHELEFMRVPTKAPWADEE